MYQNLNEKVQKLEAGIDKLPVKQRNFARGLVKFFKEKGNLSSGQLDWVIKLLAKIDGVQEAPAQEPAMQLSGHEAIFKLFTTAQQHLKKPKISFACLGETIYLRPAGTEKWKGYLWIRGAAEGASASYGKISPDGKWLPSYFLKQKPALLEALTDSLLELATNPAAFASKQGKLSGNCCFCNADLTDPKSVAVGYGPVCAEHYGLGVQWKAAETEHLYKELGKHFGGVVKSVPGSYIKLPKKIKNSFSGKVDFDPVTYIGLDYAQIEKKLIMQLIAEGCICSPVLVHDSISIDVVDEKCPVHGQLDSITCELCPEKPAYRRKDGYPLCFNCAELLVGHAA